MTTLNSVLRSMEAAARRADREAKRRQKELVRQQKDYDKLQELERAKLEVGLYENRLAILQSMHQDCSDSFDWDKIKNLKAPLEPLKTEKYETEARNNFESYKPTILQKLFKRVDKIRYSLESKIENAKKQDEIEYSEAITKYEKDKKEWQDNVSLAKRVLDGDLVAYKEAFEQLDPLSEISEIGTSLSFSFPYKTIIVVDINVNSDAIIPSEVKSLLKNGKLSVKAMPKSKFNEIYQDHICSSVLRIARESFAILPLKTVLVLAYGNLVNTQTGYKEDVPIICVLIQ